MLECSDRLENEKRWICVEHKDLFDHDSRTEMKNTSLMSVLLAGAVVTLSGCATKSGSEKVVMQPPIEGRVIDADTQLPIDHVVIVRNPQASVPGNDAYISSGEVKTRQETIYSDEDGEFKVPEKDAQSDGRRTWTSVTLKFLHPDYHMYSAEFSYTDAMTDSQAQALNTGDIALRRLPSTHGDQQ